MPTIKSIENRRAPVTAWGRDRVTWENTRKFKNMDAFESWYRPKLHGPLGINSRYLFTDILVDTLSDPPDYRNKKE